MSDQDGGRPTTSSTSNPVSTPTSSPTVQAMDIAGSTILLTGASGGLGTAIARDLAARGASLVLSARNRELLDALAAEVGGEVVVADLTDRDDVTRLTERAASCDVVVANAGLGGDPAFDDLTVDDIDRMVDTNLRAPMVMAHGYASARIAAGSPGQIVLVGSLAGLAASPGTRLYNATKFGLRGFALSFRQEMEPLGIGVSLVSPGFIRDAGMFANGGVDLPAGVRTKAPGDVAAAVARAIERNPTEVFVSPAELRAASTLATVAPGISAYIQRRLGVSDRIDR
jgi:short-subunit dehydrogenase